MGKFNGKISAEFTPPKTWVLNRELSFQTDKFTKEEHETLKEVGANITLGHSCRMIVKLLVMRG